MKRIVLVVLCALAAASSGAVEPPGPRGVILSGRVTDPEGRPVAARLWAIPDGQPRPKLDGEIPPHDMETGKDGSFAIELRTARGRRCSPVPQVSSPEESTWPILTSRSG